MSEQNVLKRSINYIEENLQEDLSLEGLAKYAGYSKYHYHRKFMKHIGVSVMEYVRYRRLAIASQLLLYTDERILDIALALRFETQESFSRAFKKRYQLAPGQYRRLLSHLTKQKEETGMVADQQIKGWVLSGSHPYNYGIGVDRAVVHKGRASGYLKHTSTEEHGGFGTMMQEFQAKHYREKRIRLSAFIKSEGVGVSAGLWMRIDNTLGEVLQFDNMSDRPITGSNEWTYCSIVLDVPDNASIIAFGILLNGPGSLWIDSISFDEVDTSIATTNLDFQAMTPEEPVNLSFEEE
ncbi:helix-turn-helix transcriptional regulator [Paenalkalicoccus suaedae]|uniref:Helix-turn-helix transcriptional regulator n=1 Tax=Paenalkalicoccus suaedae TaxID=2592382 RepID=A0A859FK10_9BACI|nr:AraC family transcriptional regulator [Paenalkalicoccus suaedae]QKS73145.1 helix-turn-helix transcriptional regulator [Paenalkalicoccus suaedae]